MREFYVDYTERCTWHFEDAIAHYFRNGVAKSEVYIWGVRIALDIIE